MLKFPTVGSDDAKATALAAVLVQELNFAYPLREQDKRNLVERLYDAPPPRTELAFQIRGGEDAGKAALAPALSAGEEADEIRRLFCMVHSEFVLISGVDIDHSFSHSNIRQNQIILIGFLNAKPAFSQLLLAKPGMSDFFREDPKDGQIKGTGYFYKICYNDIDNLWLLCHACNLKKGDCDPLAWFRSQKLYGKPFVEDVDAAGGLHEGVVLSRIYSPDPGDGVLEIGSRRIVLHAGDATGLGKYVRDWFFEHHQSLFYTHRDFYTGNLQLVKTEIERIQEIRESDIPDKKVRSEKAYKKLRKQIRELERIHKSLIELAAELSSSGSEASGAREIDDQMQATRTKRDERERHEQEKVTKLIFKNFDKADANEICSVLPLQDESKIYQPQDWRELHKQLSGLFNGVDTSPPKGEVKERLQLFVGRCRARWKEEVESFASEKRAADARAEEESRLRVEESRLRVEESRLREEESRLRAAAEAEVKRMQALLAERGVPVESSPARGGLYSTDKGFSETKSAKRDEDEGPTANFRQ